LANISFDFALIPVMKKLLSIPLALLILVSGMHFTIAAHYCEGKIAATRVSLSGKEASCGMISGQRTDNSGRTQVSKRCCDNESTVYKIDSDYSPSSFHVKDLTRNIVHEFQIPEGFSFHSPITLSFIPANVSPPDFFAANAVRMADICVFRI
jgi:hypothetical protein